MAQEYAISRTANGRLKLKPHGISSSPSDFRLVRDSGAVLLREAGYAEGDVIDESSFQLLEDDGHLYPPPGSLSGSSLEMPPHLRRKLARKGQPLNVTNRQHANLLGWRQDVTGIRRSGQAKARELAFAESSEEIYFRVFSSEADIMVTYHLLESAIPILRERGVMIGDHIDHELQWILFEGGHLYTMSAGQTDY